MAKSLQEQLRIAGLANQKQVVKARKAKNTKEKLERKGSLQRDETAEQIERQDAEKLAKDRALNRERQQAAEQRAIQAQIKQIISLNVIEDRADVEFKYQTEGLIRTLSVTEELRTALINGRVAIVGKEEKHYIIPKKVAEKIEERDATWVILLNEPTEASENGLDDEYAGYEIPDDLMW